MDPKDPIDRGRLHLAVAETSLRDGRPQSDDIRKQLVRLDAQLEQRDSVTVLAALPAIITTLRGMKVIRPGVATGVATLTQDPTPVLLPGVADAIRQLESAVDILKTLERGDV